MEQRADAADEDRGKAEVLRFAEMFAALGHEARLAIVRLLLAAHPSGLVVGEIQAELGMPASTLSHHLDILRQQGLVDVTRERQFLRYRAAAAGLKSLLSFLYAECCTRSQVIPLSALRPERSKSQGR
ncbi:MAG: metalloregulator ArsR/SmtB family transcription factor [Acidobacteriota bacterium]